MSAIVEEIDREIANLSNGAHTRSLSIVLKRAKRTIERMMDEIIDRSTQIRELKAENRWLRKLASRRIQFEKVELECRDLLTELLEVANGDVKNYVEQIFDLLDRGGRLTESHRNEVLAD